MLKVFVVVLIGGFGIAAAFDWAVGKETSFALRALLSAVLVLLLLAVLLLLIWLGIRAVEKRREHPNSN